MNIRSRRSRNRWQHARMHGMVSRAPGVARPLSFSELATYIAIGSLAVWIITGH